MYKLSQDEDTKTHVVKKENETGDEVKSIIADVLTFIINSIFKPKRKDK